MPIILAQVVLHTDSGLPEDYVVNTFHFLGPATDPIAADLAAAIDLFYNSEGTGSVTVAGYLSPSLVHGSPVHEIKFYDVTSPPAGTPYYVTTFQFDNAAENANVLPAEVALCLSYEADPVAGGVQARRRGRIYVGPLNLGALYGGAVDRPAPAVQTALIEAAEVLHNAADLAGAAWIVYSRPFAGRDVPGKPVLPPRDGSAALVDRGWVDDAWDTQRRRGIAAAGRVSATF